jgi:hypothetical protein
MSFTAAGAMFFCDRSPFARGAGAPQWCKTLCGRISPAPPRPTAVISTRFSTFFVEAFRDSRFCDGNLT